MLISLRKLHALFSPAERVQFGLLLLLMLLAGLLEVAGIGVIPVFVTAVGDPDRLLASPLIGPWLSGSGLTTSKDMLLWGGVALLVFYFLRGLFMSGYFYLENRFLEGRLNRLGRRLFTAYMLAPYPFILQRNPAELQRNAQTESTRIVYNLLKYGLIFLQQGIFMVFLLLLLLAVHPVITLLGVGFLGSFTGLLILKTHRKIKHYGLKELESNQGLIKSISQGLGALKELRVLGREAYFIRSFQDSLHGFSKSRRFCTFLSQTTMPFLEYIAIAALLGIAIFMTLRGREIITIAPALALFAAAFIRMKVGIGQVIEGWIQLRYNLVAVDPVYDDLAFLEKKPSSGHTSPGQLAAKGQPEEYVFKDSIELRNVCFSYPEQEGFSLRNVSCTIPRGCSVAFVGPTGSGKSTLVDIILGLLDPQSGRVLVDGSDLFQQLHAWRRQIGYVPQTIYLTDDTIRHNVALGIDEDSIDNDRVATVLSMARMLDFVQSLPLGWDTSVGDRGVRLSGGQRQRIGIARALYHEPDVLIMDEATSALDNETEKQVMRCLENTRGNTTLIMIAHRLSTVKACDQLHLVREGRLEASGTYDQLREQSNSFRVMSGDSEAEG